MVLEHDELYKCTHNVDSSGTMKLGHSLWIYWVNREGEGERDMMKTVLLPDLKSLCWKIIHTES